LWVALTAGILAAVTIVASPPDDASAHLYRTFLVRGDSIVWDNLWYAGGYPLASYSLLYYFPAALIGAAQVAVASIAAAAGLFSSIVVRQWGRSAVWPARAFAVFALGPAVTGTYAYALGLALLFVSLRLFQAGRVRLALVAAAVTLGASPLAFVFLCLTLVAVLAVQRQITRRVVLVGGSLGALAVGQAVVMHTFQTPGVYPFLIWNLVGVVAVSIFGVLIARLVPENGRLLVALFGVWGAACLAGYLVRSPLGDNLDRLRYVAFPLVLIAAVRVPRHRVLVGFGVVTAFIYAGVPDIATVMARDPGPATTSRYWQPAVDYLHVHAGHRYRVEVVQTSGRWEAYWLPKAGVPLARGWYRQLDLAQNAVLYRRKLDAPTYRTWLRRMAIGYVVLPLTQLDTEGAAAERRLLESGQSGLELVFRSRKLEIFAVPHAEPLLSGPGKARLTEFTHDRIGGTVSAPGTYALRVRYMPYWTLAKGAICLERARDGMTVMRVARPGPFLLTVPDEPLPLLAALLAEHPRTRCG
jgi:hypothetical protein